MVFSMFQKEFILNVRFDFVMTGCIILCRVFHDILVNIRLVDSVEHGTKIETMRYSPVNLVGQYKKCVQYGFKFTPFYNSVSFSI